MRNASKVYNRDRIRALTRRQHCLVTVEQLRECDWSSSAIRYAVDSGELEPLTRRVFRLGGSSVSSSQQALAATLDFACPAAVSHGSAAFLWDIPGFRLEPIDVTTLRITPTRDYPLANVHHPKFAIEPHIVRLDNVPVLTPIATVWSLAISGLCHPKKIERVVDNLWARRLITGRTLAESVVTFGKRGRRGTVLLRELAAARPPEFVAPESGLESRFEDIMRKRRIRGFVRQRNLGSEIEWLGRVDFVDEVHKIIIQIDSDRFHSALLDREADQRQTVALQRAGWQVLRFREWELWQEADTIASRVKAAQSWARAA